jgi:hypothetical protein
MPGAEEEEERELLKEFEEFSFYAVITTKQIKK